MPSHRSNYAYYSTSQSIAPADMDKPLNLLALGARFGMIPTLGCILIHLQMAGESEVCPYSGHWMKSWDECNTIRVSHLPRPCEYFNLIGGTSTGGSVAPLSTTGMAYCWLAIASLPYCWVVYKWRQKMLCKLIISSRDRFSAKLIENPLSRMEPSRRQHWKRRSELGGHARARRVDVTREWRRRVGEDFCVRRSCSQYGPPTTIQIIYCTGKCGYKLQDLGSPTGDDSSVYLF